MNLVETLNDLQTLIAEAELLEAVALKKRAWKKKIVPGYAPGEKSSAGGTKGFWVHNAEGKKVFVVSKRSKKMGKKSGAHAKRAKSGWETRKGNIRAKEVKKTARQQRRMFGKAAR